MEQVQKAQPMVIDFEITQKDPEKSAEFNLALMRLRRAVNKDGGGAVFLMTGGYPEFRFKIKISHPDARHESYCRKVHEEIADVMSFSENGNVEVVRFSQAGNGVRHYAVGPVGREKAVKETESRLNKEKRGLGITAEFDIGTTASGEFPQDARLAIDQLSELFGSASVSESAIQKNGGGRNRQWKRFEISGSNRMTEDDEKRSRDAISLLERLPRKICDMRSRPSITATSDFPAKVPHSPKPLVELGT